MDVQNIIAFEFTKDWRTYRLEMPVGTPVNEAYEATLLFSAEMSRMINEHIEKTKPEAMLSADENKTPIKVDDEKKEI